MHHVFQDRRQDQVLINKNKKNKKKKKKRKRKKIMGLCQRTEKDVEHASDGNTNCSWYTWNGSQRPGEKTVEIGNQK